MILLAKTTDANKADAFQRVAQSRYTIWAIYRFQYRSKDGNFYYEILLNPNDL